MAKWIDYINPFKNPTVWNPIKDEKKEQKFKGKEKKKQKKYAKSYGKALNKYVKEQKAYNKQQYAGPHGEKAFNKKIDEFQKKYGGESYQKRSALTGGQKGLLHELGKQGKQGLQNLRTPEDIGDIRHQGLYGTSNKTLKKLLKHPGISDIEKSKYYKQGGSKLQDLINNPSLMDLQDYAPFQAAQGSIEDLLNPSGQAYQAFAAPELREFNARVRPELVGQFGLGGQNNSAYNAATANAQADLQERLAKLRAGLQSEGRQQALQYGQGIQQGQAAQASIYGNAAGQGLNYANAPLTGQVAKAEIRGKAAQTGIPYLDAYLKQQGLQAQNVMEQNKFGAGLANSALGVSPYNAIYRSPQAPTNNIITGGPKPVAAFPGLPPQPQSYQPSWTSQVAGAIIPAAAGAAGAAAGAPLGNMAGSGLANFFGGGNSPQKNWGFNQMGY